MQSGVPVDASAVDHAPCQQDGEVVEPSDFRRPPSVVDQHVPVIYPDHTAQLCS